MKEDQASATAYSVLMGIVSVGRLPGMESVVSANALAEAEAMLSATNREQNRKPRRRLNLVDNPATNRILDVAEHLLIPGMKLQYAIRKRYIEKQVRHAITYGATQVINVGAGFDELRRGTTEPTRWRSYPGGTSCIGRAPPSLNAYF